MDKVFQALASSSRRRMLDIVSAQPGCGVVDVCRHFDVSRIAVMKHLGVLEAADLIIARKTGRRKSLFFNAVPIQQIHERWTDDYSAHWSGKLTALKRNLENSSK